MLFDSCFIFSNTFYFIPRRTLLELSKFEDRQKCLKSSFKLKGSDIYVNEDVLRIDYGGDQENKET